MTSDMRLRVSAVLAALLFSVGYIVVLMVPGGGDVTDRDFTDFYDSDDRIFVSFLLYVVLLAAAWSIVWFFTEVKARLRDDLLSQAALAIALLGCGGLTIGGALLSAPGGVQMNSDAGFVGIPIAHTFAQAGLGVMLVVGMYSLALATALVSVAARRDALVPSWLSIAGIVIAVLMIGSFIWLPGYVFPLWILTFGLFVRSGARG